MRKTALAALAVLIVTTSAVSFAESYHGLYLWAGHHGLTGLWSIAWPLQLDVFIAVGELALFVALADGLGRPVTWNSLDSNAARPGPIGHRERRPRRRLRCGQQGNGGSSAARRVGGTCGRAGRAQARCRQQDGAGLGDGHREVSGAVEIPAIEPVASRTPKQSKPAARAAAVVAGTPDISGAELGRKLGVSERTGRRLLAVIGASV